MLLIENGKVITMNGEIYERGSVLIDGGKIIEVGENIKAVKGAEVIDAKGCWVLPGLIDAHCHIGVMEEKVGDGMWKFDTFHFGIHPNAVVLDDQCPNAIYKRIIDHSHSSNVHWHVGSAPAAEGYNYYPHITADIRHATLKVNDTLVYDNGYLECLQDPRVLEVAAQYPDLPGVPDKVVVQTENVLA